MRPITEIDQSKLDQFNSDFEVATAKDLAQLWQQHKDQIDLAAPPSEPTILSELLLTHWATKDGRAAIEALLKLPESAFLRGVFPQSMLAWAENDPKGAFDWYFAPEQSELRADEDLVAGQRFTQAIFRWRSTNDPKMAAASIDLLEMPEEVLGAIQGLRNTAENYSANADNIIEKQLKELKVKGDEAREAARVGTASRAAARQLREPRARLMEEFISSRLKQLGETDN
jgi:hypothetical protein